MGGFPSPHQNSVSVTSLSSAANNNNTNNNPNGPSTPSNPSNGADVDFRERAQNFEEAFNKIRIATGINDIDELVQTFIKNEEHNFSLFNYVNEQNNEIEKYEEQIAQLREEEMKYAQESGNDVNQHKEILKDLESKLQSTDSMAEKYELRCQDLSRIIESLKRGMQSITSKLDWENTEEVIATVGNASPTPQANNPSTTPSATATNNNNIPVITEINMVNYLGILEKKSIQLLHQYHHVQQLLLSNAPGNKSSALEVLHGASATPSDPLNTQVPATDADKQVQSLVTVFGAGPKIPMGQDHLHVNPPKSDDYRSDEEEDDEEDETRPLTRDELKSRTLNRLQKRIQGLNHAANSINNTTGGVGLLKK